jgi:hypothetical protein
MRPVGTVDQALFQRLQQHHGAGDRQRQAEHEARAELQPHSVQHADAEQGRQHDLADRAGYGDAPHRQQVGARNAGRRRTSAA